MMTTAHDLGWDERWSAYVQVAAMNAPMSGQARDGLCPARVVAVHRGGIEVLPLPDGGAEPGPALAVGLKAPGHATHGEEWPPIVGDWVALQPGGGAGPVIRSILPRRSYLERPSASGRSVGQPIAANVDVVLIAEPMDPGPSVGRIERLTALARSAGAQAWLVLTKADLADPESVAQACRRLGMITDEALAVSASDPRALQALRDRLAQGMTAVLLGRSGAGKSTLTNALLGTDLATQEVRASDSKGRHTTTSRQLIAGQGISIIDTPGIRALAATADGQAIDETFRDLVELAAGCRYADCTHTSEPDCAVRQAVASGGAEADRLERYQRMVRESSRLDLRRNARLLREEQRRATRRDSRGRRGTMRLKGRRD